MDSDSLPQRVAPQPTERQVRALYDELKRIAAREMGRERRGHTLQTTALAHEAWLRLGPQLNCLDRTQFIGIAAHTIRRVLIDHARHRRVRGQAERLRLETAELSSADLTPDPVDLIALDGALEELARLSERQARVIELRFFGGLSVDEAAAALGVSARTVDGDWHVARAWLARAMRGPAAPDAAEDRSGR